MPALDWITVHGFKSIATLERMPLKPINVVIGPNGVGKSNFIGVFSFLHAIREGRLQDYVGKAGGAERLLFFGSKTTQQIFIQISFEDELNQYSIALEPTETDDLIPSSEQVYFWDKSKFPRPWRDSLMRNGKEAGISNPKENGRVASYVRADLARWRLYHVHDTSASSPMRKTCDVEDNDFFRPDGSNLAAFLYYLDLKHPVEYGLIRKAVQTVAPFFDDFHLKPSKLNEDKIRLEWRHKNSDLYFDASSLSDGTLRFIALTTLFLQPMQYRPSVILVDEPELGLHPYAIQMFASLVRQASPKTQVIISTQSSLLLDYFEPEEVLVANRVNGGTQFMRLDPTQLEEWLEDYSLGQLWEKNEIGGRPGEQT